MPCPAPPRKACWSVPFQRNPRFVGRISEIADVDVRLSTENHCERVAIIGLGGVGKTQIALEFAYRLRERRPDCSVFWVPATGIESLQQAYLDIGHQLQFDDLGKEQADIKKLIQDHLSRESAGQWLLVFDGADDDMWIDKAGNATESRRLIDYMPKSSHGSILFTTRSRKIAVNLANENVIRIGEMDEKAAKQVLRKSLIDQGLLSDDRITIEFLKQLTFLPLAIIQAAAYINKNEISLSEYLALLEDKEQNIIELLSEDFEDEGRYRDVKNPVANTWLISFEQIRRRDPLSAEYLSFMSCIDPKGIPQSLLPPAPSAKKTADAIGTLSAYSFINKRPVDQSLDLHPLVHLATRNWLKQEETLANWTANAVARLDDCFPSNDHKNMSLWRTYLPHVRYVLDSDLLQEGAQGRLPLLQKSGLCLQSDGMYNEAERSFEQVMETRKRVLGQHHPDTLNSVNDLAFVLRHQGKYKEAENMSRRAVDGRVNTLGREHLDTLTSVNNLAEVLRNQGEYKEAEERIREVIEGREKVLGKEHPDTLTSVSHLAEILTSQDKYDEAEKMHRQALEGRKKALGNGHFDTLISVSNLALVLKCLERYKEAEEMILQAVEGRKKLLGEDHVGTLASINILALVLEAQGKYEAAEEKIRQALEGRERKLGKDHPSTLTSVSILASILQNQGMYRDAEEMHRRALEGRERVLGNTHPNTLASFHSLASVTNLRESQSHDRGYGPVS